MTATKRYRITSTTGPGTSLHPWLAHLSRLALQTGVVLNWQTTTQTAGTTNAHLEFGSLYTPEGSMSNEKNRGSQRHRGELTLHF